MINKTMKQEIGKTRNTWRIGKTRNTWSVGKARKAERALMDLLRDIPEISHLEGCSYSGLRTYKVQFMFQEKNQSRGQYCVMEYSPFLEQLDINEYVIEVSKTPVVISNKVLKRISKFCPKANGGRLNNGGANFCRVSLDVYIQGRKNETKNTR